MISFSQDSCLASNGCPPPLGIPNRDSTCYAAVALHVVASVHDTSVTGVVLPSVSLPSGTVQKIVDTISAGGSVGQQKMVRLLSLVEGADYERGKQQDAVEFLKKMTAFDIGVTDSWTETGAEINVAVILEMHVNGLSRFLHGDIGAGLQYPHLEACGLPNLRAGLRTRAHGAPTSVYRPPSLETDLRVPLPLPAPQVGPSGSGGMVAAAVLALGPLEVPDNVGQQPKRARRHTQTPEGKRQVAAEKKRRQRAQKRGRDLDENNH